MRSFLISINIFILYIKLFVWIHIRNMAKPKPREGIILVSLMQDANKDNYC